MDLLYSSGGCIYFCTSSFCHSDQWFLRLSWIASYEVRGLGVIFTEDYFYITDGAGVQAVSCGQHKPEDGDERSIILDSTHCYLSLIRLPPHL